jgi:hypothetical protein
VRPRAKYSTILLKVLILTVHYRTVSADAGHLVFVVAIGRTIVFTRDSIQNITQDDPTDSYPAITYCFAGACNG